MEPEPTPANHVHVGRPDRHASTPDWKRLKTPYQTLQYFHVISMSSTHSRSAPPRECGTTHRRTGGGEVSFWSGPWSVPVLSRKFHRTWAPDDPSLPRRTVRDHVCPVHPGVEVPSRQAGPNESLRPRRWVSTPPGLPSGTDIGTVPVEGHKVVLTRRYAPRRRGPDTTHSPWHFPRSGKGDDRSPDVSTPTRGSGRRGDDRGTLPVSVLGRTTDGGRVAVCRVLGIL